MVFASTLVVSYGQSLPEAIIDSVRTAEQSAGVQPTENFSRIDTRVTAYYRCYYTGLVDLPSSYDDLKLRQGTQIGCSIDQNKYDVFFYPIEAVASGHTPVTEALETASAERIATVVPHEDFHSQIRELPAAIAESAATLVGFVLGDAAVSQPTADADLFLKKADLINRYYDRLHEMYREARRNKRRALAEKKRLFEMLEQDCQAIPGDSRSFNKCVSAPNNAGLAFDYTYTRYYPLLYRIFSACERDAKCLVATIVKAPPKRPGPDVVAYFESFISSTAAHKPD